MLLFYNAAWLGADDDFYKFNRYFLGYKPISSCIFSALRFDGSLMLGDAHLYALPFIQLLGVPAKCYQSNNTMLIETEWRFATKKNDFRSMFLKVQVKAFESFDQFDAPSWVYNFGGGFRYKIAGAFGMHSGLDFAWSNIGDFAFYSIFGSAWFK